MMLWAFVLACGTSPPSNRPDSGPPMTEPRIDSGAAAITGTPLPEGTVHATWVWAPWDASCLTPAGSICYGGETGCTTTDGAPCEATPSVWFDDAMGQALVESAAHNDVSPLYVSTYYPRGRALEVGDASHDALLYRDAELALVAEAQAVGVEVWAMMSLGHADLDPAAFHGAHADGTACDPAAVYEPLSRVLDILRFNGSEAGFRFDGLYIDLEPDIAGLASDEDGRDADTLAMTAVLDLLACANELVGDAPLPLATTVSWRWDAELAWRGTTASMASHLYGLALDHYVVVPYYDRTSVLLERAEPFVIAASAAGLLDRVAVAMETQDCGPTSACDEATTFYECGHWGYVRVLQEIVAGLDEMRSGDDPPVRGVVTHAYGKAYLSDGAGWPALAVLEGDWPALPQGCNGAP